MMAFLEMSPWRRAFWSIPVTLFIVLLWPVPLAHPEAHPLLVIVRAQAPGLYTLWVWGGPIAPGVLFFFSWQVFGSIFNLWFRSLADKHSRGKLPAWPLAVNDKGPALVIGEKHYPTEMREHPHPQWCVMPEKGLYTGLAIFGAIGTGKTSSCMYPFVRQLFNWQHDDLEKRVAGLILEVKGDFCYAVQDMMKERGRLDDYMEITTMPGKGMLWNPMNCPWLDTYSLAYTLASIVNQLFGGGKDPFWQMAYTNCVRWIIQSYRVFPDPWFTFHDIYNCMVDKKALLEQVNAATEHVYGKHVYGKYIYVLQMSRADFNQHREDLLTLQLWPPGVDPDTSVTSPCPGRAGFLCGSLRAGGSSTSVTVSFIRRAISRRRRSLSASSGRRCRLPHSRGPNGRRRDDQHHTAARPRPRALPISLRESSATPDGVMSTHSVSSSASSDVDFDDAMLTPMRATVIPPLRLEIRFGFFARYPR